MTLSHDSAPPPSSSDGRTEFARFLKPRLMELLAAIGLDVVYHRAQGDRLWFRDESGREVEVLDLLGGYGASLLGHNNPELVARARAVLEDGRPFHAQASARGLAGLLARRLSDAIGRTTGREYVVTLANSGTEAVEAAIKHAEMEMAVRIERILQRLERVRREVRLRLRNHTAKVPESLYARAARFFDLPRIDDLDELFLRVLRHDLDVLGREPCFLALTGAFHGKSTGSLKITNNPSYRSPWRRIGLRAVFVDPGDEAALAREIARETVKWLDLELGEDGTLALVERDLANVSAAFVEPIQGEGGIREVSPAFLKTLRSAADAGGFPLVIDEIQSGLGRTGQFLASGPSGVRGDYYLFSKALGGSLAKVSALAVDRERYVADYGYLHTSTFADDDHSSAVALGVLDLLERDDGAAIRRAGEQGEKLLLRLRALQARFPGVLRDVRGRGLMLGFELARQDRSGSPLIRVLSEQALLGFFVSGWLLHEERIRVTPTLSSHGTIRLEPSCFIADAEIDRFGNALERLLGILERGDAASLARFLVGRAREPGPPEPPPRREPPAWLAKWTPPQVARKVGFLVHFLEPSDLKAWESGLASLSDEECGRFLERTAGLLEPFVVDRAVLRSARGDVVDLCVIGVSFTPEQAMAAMRAGETGWIQELIEKGVGLAKREGCQIVGFGGYTSIVTDNCQTIVEPDVVLTSGNSLTAAAALDAVALAVKRCEIARPVLGVVGAAGNIGCVLGEVAADEVEEILLVGRAGARSRLEAAAAEIYFGAWKRLGERGAASGLARAIAETKTVRDLRASGAKGVEARIGEAIRAGLERELGSRAPVTIASEMEALRKCNVVLTATNAPRPVILPQHLGPGPVVVGDIAAPRDVDPSVLRERKDVLVLKGGILRAPLGQKLSLAGLRLEEGQLYGCMAETILLGFANAGSHFSFGRLTAANVRRIQELARMHGFVVEEERATE